MKMKTEQEELQERLDVCVNYLDLFESVLSDKEREALQSDIDNLVAQLGEMSK